MRVGSSYRGYRSPISKQQGKSVDDMKKSEIISDIFNHKPVDPADDKRDARVHLSNASKALSHELQKNVKHFLEEHKEITKYLSEIELPEEFEQDLGGDLSVRKLKVYLKWLDLNSQGASEPGPNEKPYHGIKSLNKDNEIKKIYSENDQKRHEIQKHRSKHQPSYYYMVFPETYSFN